jgi:cell division protein FtsB
MAGLFRFVKQQLLLQQQHTEITELRAELETLKNQNSSMRQGMRRCVSCEYRIEYKNRKQAET